MGCCRPPCTDFPLWVRHTCRIIQLRCPQSPNSPPLTDDQRHTQSPDPNSVLNSTTYTPSLKRRSQASCLSMGAPFPKAQGVTRHSKKGKWELWVTFWKVLPHHSVLTGNGACQPVPHSDHPVPVSHRKWVPQTGPHVGLIKFCYPGLQDTITSFS